MYPDSSVPVVGTYSLGWSKSKQGKKHKGLRILFFFLYLTYVILVKSRGFTQTLNHSCTCYDMTSLRGTEENSKLFLLMNPACDDERLGCYHRNTASWANA